VRAAASEPAIDLLIEALSGPLPSLPAGSVAAVAAELRRMESPQARAVWVHPGWARTYAWVASMVPDADPVVPTVHALRRAPSVRANPASVDDVARLVVAIARRAASEQGRTERTLACDPVDERPIGEAVSDSSVVPEARALLDAAGIEVSSAVWALVSATIDIAVDWWDAFANQSTLCGAALVAAARDSANLSSERRLRSYLDGPVGRPLVALLLGGDQWGRAARRSSGQEASLVLWALATRRAAAVGCDAPVVPAGVARAWSVTLALVADAIGECSVPGGLEGRPAA
jgi:hypothetical protein